MKKWKLLAGVLLVFVFGVLMGSLGTGFYHQYLFDRFRKDPGDRQAFILKKFSERLELTENQQKEFKIIIDQVDQERRAQIQKNRSEFKRIRDESYAQMKKVLTPDQQNIFDELIKEFRERHKSKPIPER